MLGENEEMIGQEKPDITQTKMVAKKKKVVTMEDLIQVFIEMEGEMNEHNEIIR